MICDKRGNKQLQQLLLFVIETDESSPISAHYMKLKADIAPLPTESPEFDMIQEYLNNTHAATHTSYTLKIEQVTCHVSLYDL